MKAISLNSITFFLTFKFSSSSTLQRTKSISSSEESLFTISNQSTQSCDVTLSQEDAIESGPPKVPAGVNEFDRENWDDPNQVSHYAMDIFNYLKGRESEFIIEPYMSRQQHLTPWMRTLLVDWMVEVQETFELNHETLYLAVKLVDIYLNRVGVEKDKLQLVGAASLFLACKYDVSNANRQMCTLSNSEITLPRIQIKSFILHQLISIGADTTID